MKIALKINVATYRGTLQGIPRLVDILRRNRAGATFALSLGKDHTGRALREAFGAIAMKRAPHESVVAHYGLQTLMYGTLLPGPDIGRRCTDIMRATRDAGFETAIHSWNHRRWLHSAETADAIWTEIEMRRAHERYAEIFGVDSPGCAAAGWQMNVHALRLTQRLAYDWASDCRGSHPFMPVWNGEVVHCPQLPTTLPTVDELLGLNGTSEETVHQHLLGLTAPPREAGHVFTLHAELEGIRHGALLESLLAGWREQGYEICSLARLREGIDPTQIPRCEILRGNVPGRAGSLMIQGNEFLSSWKDAA